MPEIQVERRRTPPPQTIPELAYRVLTNQGLATLIALAAVFFLGFMYRESLTNIERMVRDHVRESTWYQRQMCVNLAVLAGSSPALCSPEVDPAAPRRSSYAE